MKYSIGDLVSFVQRVGLPKSFRVWQNIAPGDIGLVVAIVSSTRVEVQWLKTGDAWIMWHKAEIKKVQTSYKL